MLLRALLLTALLPFAVTFSAILAGVWWRGGARSENRGYLVAVALGYVAAHIGLRGWPPFPAVESLDWLPCIALLAAAVGIVEAAWPSLGRARWLLRLVVVAAALWALSSPLLQYTWSALHAAIWMAGLEIAVLGFWALIENHLRRDDPVASPAALLVVATGASGVILLANSALLAQLAGVLAATIGALLLGALLTPSLRPAPGSGAALAMLLSSTWLLAYFYADLPTSSLILLPLACCGAWLGHLLRRRGAGRWVALAVEVAATAIIVALAAAEPLMATLASQGEPYY